MQLKVSHAQVQLQYLDKIHDKKPLEGGQRMFWKWNGSCHTTAFFPKWAFIPSRQSARAQLRTYILCHKKEPTDTKTTQWAVRFVYAKCSQKTFSRVTNFAKNSSFEHFLAMYTLLCCSQCLHLCGGALVGNGSSTLWAGKWRYWGRGWREWSCMYKGRVN